tara:strand:+ start:4984 stop:5178 length:195 start_codon:yes stop_codon:yes gene_type:complete
MLTGTVKVWNRNKGWGFIVGTDGEDYFLNIKNLRTGQKIKEGARVKFDAEESQNGTQAINVTLY